MAYLCPICGKSNACAMGKNKPGAEQGCWCMTVEFPKSYTDYIPENALGERCICQACLQKISNNKELLPVEGQSANKH